MGRLGLRLTRRYASRQGKGFEKLMMLHHIWGHCRRNAKDAMELLLDPAGENDLELLEILEVSHVVVG